jgi:hypothetical protein
MNGQQCSSHHHLFVLLVIICGCALPAIDGARYRRTISVNWTGCCNRTDDRMPGTQNPVWEISRKNYWFVDVPVRLKTKIHEIFMRALLEPGIGRLVKKSDPER